MLARRATVRWPLRRLRCRPSAAYLLERFDTLDAAGRGTLDKGTLRIPHCGGAPRVRRMHVIHLSCWLRIPDATVDRSSADRMGRSKGSVYREMKGGGARLCLGARWMAP